MIQDRPSRRLREASAVADQLTKSGVKVIVVGSQSSVRIRDLRSIASSPYDIISVSAYSRLLGRVDQLARIMCLPFGTPTYDDPHRIIVSYLIIPYLRGERFRPSSGETIIRISPICASPINSR